ncbi:MAG: chemotaxis-specific protein-glutamate methyltransferase CheB [Eubacterium sp.]|nr:chemotaxis-specific protein-glutamate methyltransferase CheB [Eubacterium sp.]
MKKVLVIDDSALMRRVISDIINQDEQLTVAGTANNGEAALDQIRRGEKYDILLVDIKMPKMDGVKLLRELKKFRLDTAPSLIVSSIASESGHETIEALELGAIDFIKKPTSSIGDEFASFRTELLNKVYVVTGLSAKGTDFVSAITPKQPESVRQRVMPKVGATLATKKHSTIKGSRLCFIASSTGGPKALQSVIPFFPKNFPYPVVVVQHMPVGFTATLAERLDKMSQITVKEAEDGEILRPGIVYIAMGGKQCELVCKPGGQYCFSENDKPPRGGLKPCADIFLESLVDASYEEIICGVLTGMGSDGSKGIELIKSVHNVKCVAQNKDTCVVYGMPRAAVELGIVDEVVPLEDVTGMMLHKLGLL